MEIDISPSTYEAQKASAFMRSREQHGSLSNMTGGFPLRVNGMKFQSPEGLYQALKFPHEPSRQAAIAKAPSGMQAKRTAYAAGAKPMPSWDDVRVQAMAYTIAVKLAQHPDTFGTALRATGQRPIVERSNRDVFWGANPSGAILKGRNVLGKILQAARDKLGTDDTEVKEAVMHLIAHVPRDTFEVNGRPIRLPEQ